MPFVSKQYDTMIYAQILIIIEKYLCISYVRGYALIYPLQTVAFWAHFLEDYYMYFIQTSTTKFSYLTVCTRIGYKTIALAVKAFIDMVS